MTPNVELFSHFSKKRSLGELHLDDLHIERLVNNIFLRNQFFMSSHSVKSNLYLIMKNYQSNAVTRQVTSKKFLTSQTVVVSAFSKI